MKRKIIIFSQKFFTTHFTVNGLKSRFYELLHINVCIYTSIYYRYGFIEVGREQNSLEEEDVNDSIFSIMVLK